MIMVKLLVLDLLKLFHLITELRILQRQMEVSNFESNDSNMLYNQKHYPVNEFSGWLEKFITLVRMILLVLTQVVEKKMATSLEQAVLMKQQQKLV